jgi:uncharacterized protein with HEPN domain
VNSRAEHQRLDDILASIAAIRAHGELRDSAVVPDGLVADAVKYRLVEIGEAVGDLSDETRALKPDTPWTRIKGMRSLLTHQYHDVDMTRVWNVVDEHLPPLEAAVREILKAHPGTGPR